MNNKIRYLMTALVIACIVIAIVFLQNMKAKPVTAVGNTQKEVTAIETNQGLSPEQQRELQIKAAKYQKAPELVGTQAWINSEPLKILELKGKVVLVDFWTYTCINCIRTLPYLREWDRKYRDKGLVIIGVHTPEFEFEKELENVQKAVEKYELKYAVVQDNDYATWRAYKNRYWPHKYLIDKDGYIRYDHIGEGAYEETEKMIHALLQERRDYLNLKKEMNEIISKPNETIEVDFGKIATPEIYLGYGTNRGNFGQEFKPENKVTYTLPGTTKGNLVYLEGDWINNFDNMELASDKGKLILVYQARNVNIVAGSDSEGNVKVVVNSNPVTFNKGFDVDENSTAKITNFRLYNLVTNDSYDGKPLELHIGGKGLKIFTFTFG